MSRNRIRLEPVGMDGTRRGLHVDVRLAEAASILSPTSGFIAAAGFTHSLSPARNCTFGCSYCYVPTLRVFGGLRHEEWSHWGAFTTVKANAAELLRRTLRPQQRIYCSPLVDPYQPAEAVAAAMPPILREMRLQPPAVFVVQTRGPLITRDLDALVDLAGRTRLRISFSLTTNREEVRRRYEPHCASLAQRIEAIGRLRAAGLDVYATLAPLLPCDPEVLAELALAATEHDIIADPLHSRANRARGAITREAALRISQHAGFAEWHNSGFQADVIARLRHTVEDAGRRLGIGPTGFAWLSET
jgi:DNA repair photolyase